jgi:hypothetical protein
MNIELPVESVHSSAHAWAEQLRIVLFGAHIAMAPRLSHH